MPASRWPEWSADGRFFAAVESRPEPAVVVRDSDRFDVVHRFAIPDAKKPVAIVAHVLTANGVAELMLGTTGGHPTVVAVDEAAVERFKRTFGVT